MPLLCEYHKQKRNRKAAVFDEWDRSLEANPIFYFMFAQKNHLKLFNYKAM